MKRAIAVFLLLVMCFSLFGCKSKEERELERAREAAAEAAKAAERAQENYDDLIRDIQRYEDALSRVQNAK